MIAHNIRSTHNVGSLLRTAEGLGVATVFLTGYTPYPEMPKDQRLPHISTKITKDIQKTALGAEKLQKWVQNADIRTVIHRLKKQGYTIYALEQTIDAVRLPGIQKADKCAILLGSEVTGIADELLKESDIRMVIPMYGKKESFNVIQATAMALYEFRFFD